ncbi:MAG TPA: hypothetical protein VFE88_03515 [Candidatus Nanoarchaeia archaeon]|nr:hypothetical protein [Candidatus Nanoarchaeia archaeon]
MTVTTIQIEKNLITVLKKAKEYPRQTYNELLQNMLKVYNNTKKRNHYDEFLHKIQQAKMKELWDNKADEDWENA